MPCCDRSRDTPMYHAFYQCYKATMNWAMGLNRHEWLVMLALVTVIGFFCMRGFGSRNNY
jgi:hypothetical protein